MSYVLDEARRNFLGLTCKLAVGLPFVTLLLQKGIGDIKPAFSFGGTGMLYIEHRDEQGQVNNWKCLGSISNFSMTVGPASLPQSWKKMTRN